MTRRFVFQRNSRRFVIISHSEARAFHAAARGARRGDRIDLVFVLKYPVA